MNTYAAYHVMYDGWDPMGLASNILNWHHLVPQEFKEHLPQGYLHSSENGHMMMSDDHKALHNEGWNKEWGEYFEDNPNPTKRELDKQLDKMKKKKNYSCHLNKGLPADRGYWDWKKNATKSDKDKIEKELKKISAKPAPKKASVFKRFAKKIPIVGGLFVAANEAHRGASASEAIGKGAIEAINPTPVGLDDVVDAGRRLSNTVHDKTEEVGERGIDRRAKNLGMTPEEYRELMGCD